MSTTKQDRDEARERLLEILEPGDEVLCVLRHVSRSGMTRWIDFYVARCKDGERNPAHLWLSYNIALACGYTFTREREAVKVEGCGMDMGFAVVYQVAKTLFPDGFACTGERCPSNDHSNRVKADHHKDGGYALRHRWLG